jgi:hypothetical protein
MEKLRAANHDGGSVSGGFGSAKLFVLLKKAPYY